MLALCLLLLGCRFEAATKVSDDSGATHGGGDGGEEEEEEEAQEEEEEKDPDEIDDDGDGWTEDDGDCDDDDGSVYPDAEDGCDGIDSDCDEEIDEDARGDDEYEPNDDRAYDLGDLEDDDVISVSALLHNDEDVDLYEFDMEDSTWGLFTLTVRLSGIPDDANVRMTLDFLEDDTTIDQEYGGGTLTITHDDTAIVEDGGTYRITVEAMNGVDCDRSYLLSIDLE